MVQSLEELLQRVEQHFKEKKYQELILLLSDNVLEQYNSSTLYAWKARAHGRLSEIELAFKHSQKAIDINPLDDMAYFAKASSLAYWKKHWEAIENFNKAIQLNENNVDAYIGRGIVRGNQKQFIKSIEDFNKAIYLDKKNVVAYTNRGVTNAMQRNYTKAISDYNKAIRLDENYADAYISRGIALGNQKKIDEAIKDFSKAIELNDKIARAFYHRAVSNKLLSRYQAAIDDYIQYIKLVNKSDDYHSKVALAEIEELRKKITNIWYEEIDNLISGIKKLLLFNKSYLTHYTSLSGAKAMILNKSLFRLSEGAFLNDTSEGRELFKHLSFDIIKPHTNETIASSFVEKPFIGSFVAENKHNDLTLWRMYGKEAQAEAKGCALTINKEQFIVNLEKELSPIGDDTNTSFQREEQFTFYKVAYINNDASIFMIPESVGDEEIQLNQLMQELKVKINNLDEERKISITKLLNDIAYLFKSSEYQYEQEVRLVVQGVGFKKNIIKEATPPRVYIELVEIVPVLQKITLGPKVERAEEWAAAFNYHIKEEYPQRKEQVEIVISHLPFK